MSILLLDSLKLATVLGLDSDDRGVGGAKSAH